MPFTPPDAYRVASPRPGEDVADIDGPESPPQTPTVDESEVTDDDA